MEFSCPEILRNSKKTVKTPKRRGRRGGVRARELESVNITLSSVRSLNNKVDELGERLKFDKFTKKSFNLLHWDLAQGRDWSRPSRIELQSERMGIKIQVTNQSEGDYVFSLMITGWLRCTYVNGYVPLITNYSYLPIEFGQITIVLTYLPGPKFEEAACGLIRVLTRLSHALWINLYLFW